MFVPAVKLLPHRLPITDVGDCEFFKVEIHLKFELNCNINDILCHQLSYIILIFTIFIFHGSVS